MRPDIFKTWRGCFAADERDQAHKRISELFAVGVAASTEGAAVKDLTTEQVRQHCMEDLNYLALKAWTNTNK